MNTTPRMARIFSRAEDIAAAAPVGTEHVLQALAEDTRGIAGRVLERYVSSEALIAELHAMTSTAGRGGHPGPWTSRIVEGPDGQPIVEPDGMLRQYFVDGNGNEILDAEGRRQRAARNPDRTPILDDDGYLKLEPLPET